MDKRNQLTIKLETQAMEWNQRMLREAPDLDPHTQEVLEPLTVQQGVTLLIDNETGAITIKL